MTTGEETGIMSRFSVEETRCRRDGIRAAARLPGILAHDEASMHEIKEF